MARRARLIADVPSKGEVMAKRPRPADLEAIPARNGKRASNGDGRSSVARSAAETPEASAQKPARTRAHSAAATFRPRMPMGEFLFAYLHHRGVKHSFGVPGDFALPTFAWLEKSPIQSRSEERRVGK